MSDVTAHWPKWWQAPKPAASIGAQVKVAEAKREERIARDSLMQALKARNGCALIDPKKAKK